MFFSETLAALTVLCRCLHHSDQSVLFVA